MRRLLIFGGLGGLVFLGLGCLGFVAPLDLLGNLLLGWIFFLGRVVPQLSVNWAGVTTAAMCLGLLAGGLHLLFQWFVRESPLLGEKEFPSCHSWSRHWTTMILAGVILLFVAGIAAVGIVHQTAWLVISPEPLLEKSPFREAAERVKSANHLKQIGLALHEYHDANDTFPPGGTINAQGRLMHGWQTSILPYLEQEKLYQSINLKVPWNHPDNARAFQTTVLSYLRPDGIPLTHDTAGWGLSHYAGNVRVLGGDVPWSQAMITDGTPNTLMAGEVVAHFKPWGYPANWRDPAKGINRSPDGFGSPHREGANFLFADGSVRFLRDNMDANVLKALSTPTGGEKIPDF